MVQMSALLSKYHGDIDVEFGKMMYRFQDPVEHTFYIGHRMNQSVVIAVPDRGDNGVMYQCTGAAARQIYHSTTDFGPGIPQHDQTGIPEDLLDTLYSFYTLKLKYSPEEVAVEARQSARMALSQTDMALRFMELGRENLATYLLLREKFEDASDEMYRARNYYNDAWLANDNEALYLFGRAVTAYTRAEAKFNEIYELLNPPPATPDDLGLEPIEPPRAW